MHNVTITRISRCGALAVVTAAALLASGCTNGGSRDSANVVAGKELFVKKCGSCHVLNRAGTKGVIGPNLDSAFASVRVEHQGDEAIRGVVLGQILYPGRGGVMPAKIVDGDQANDVAAYVAEVASKPGKDTGLLAKAGQTASTDGKAIFTQNCGSCHILSAAGTNGNSGPNLDQTKPDLARVTQQVNAGGGAMPAFKGTLTEEQVAAVAKYVSSVAGQ